MSSGVLLSGKVWYNFKLDQVFSHSVSSFCGGKRVLWGRGSHSACTRSWTRCSQTVGSDSAPRKSGSGFTLSTIMPERSFSNTLPDFTPVPDLEGKRHETEKRLGIPVAPEGVGVNLTGLPEGPNLPAVEVFSTHSKQAVDEIVDKTWTSVGGIVQDPMAYTGTMGTAVVCLRSYEHGRNEADLATCLRIVDACAAAASRRRPTFTFLCGQPGIYAVGAAAAKLKGDERLLKRYLGLFTEMGSDPVLAAGPDEGGHALPCELLYGRAGFLWAALFVNKHVGPGTIPERTTGPIVQALLAEGRAGVRPSGDPPLMYHWHGTEYWGAAHGLAGICHVLLHFPLVARDMDDLRATLKYMVQHRFGSGNYPSSEGSTKDRLVQWCHGAAGVALALCKAAETLPDGGEFLEAAIEAGDVVWERGLLRKVGLCHGVSGNAYTFLALYRATGGGQRHLHRAKAFASFLLENRKELVESGEMHGGDRPYSLMEGNGGPACLFLDMLDPVQARFPGFEL
eukprot:jgi/Mesen1/4827/ME000243S04003